MKTLFFTSIFTVKKLILNPHQLPLFNGQLATAFTFHFTFAKPFANSWSYKNINRPLIQSLFGILHY